MSVHHLQEDAKVLFQVASATSWSVTRIGLQKDLVEQTQVFICALSAAGDFRHCVGGPSFNGRLGCLSHFGDFAGLRRAGSLVMPTPPFGVMNAAPPTLCRQLAYECMCALCQLEWFILIGCSFPRLSVLSRT